MYVGVPTDPPPPPPGEPGGCHIYISSNLHPSPNSRWLHHRALRYVQRAQSGAYMWWKGLNLVKTGSKRAKNTCLSIPNSPGSLLEKRVFDPPDPPTPKVWVNQGGGEPPPPPPTTPTTVAHPSGSHIGWRRPLCSREGGKP